MDGRERLEVEDDDERQRRLGPGQLLKRVDQAGENTLGADGSSVTLPTSPGASALAPAVPPTDLLDRVRQFLPQLAESNASLSGRDQHELDIENVGSGGSYYIEMNLGLGVFERAGSDEGSSSSLSSSSSVDDCDSEGSDSGSSGSSSYSEDVAQAAARPKKPLPRRAIPSITVLNGSENPPGGGSSA